MDVFILLYVIIKLTSEKYMENLNHLLPKKNLSINNRIILKNIRVKPKVYSKINLNVLNAIRK
jgi:hypothetical protein